MAKAAIKVEANVRELNLYGERFKSHAEQVGVILRKLLPYDEPWPASLLWARMPKAGLIIVGATETHLMLGGVETVTAQGKPATYRVEAVPMEWLSYSVHDVSRVVREEVRHARLARNEQVISALKAEASRDYEKLQRLEKELLKQRDAYYVSNNKWKRALD